MKFKNKNTPKYTNKKDAYKNYTISQKPSQPKDNTNIKHKTQTYHTHIHTKLLTIIQKQIDKK